MEDLIQKWEAAKKLISENTEPTSFNTFIAPLKPLELRGNELFLQMELSFSKNSLEKLHFTKITDALYKVFGFPVTPVFVDKPEYDEYKRLAPAVEAPEKTDFGLLPSFTFDTFVVGSSNRMAHAASLAVAEMPGKAYNPLYLYGHSGLGKTHLMNAIGNYVLGRNPFCKLLYITSEDFTVEVVEAIQKNNTQKLREKYRNLDILIIDDIQFIAGKDRTEEEFFHTFEALARASKQIIISGDRPPSEMTILPERIRYRLIEGLTCDLQPPDYETRLAILKKKCLEEDLEVPAYILEYIAENVVTNIRVLKGALTKVKMHACFSDKTLSPAELEELLKDIIEPTVKNITVEQIIQKVSEYYDISVEDIISPKHHKEINLARQVAMFIARQLTSKSLKEIGKYFNRDYTTVINGLNRVEKHTIDDAQLKEAINIIIHSLREPNY